MKHELRSLSVNTALWSGLANATEPIAGKHTLTACAPSLRRWTTEPTKTPLHLSRREYWQRYRLTFLVKIKAITLGIRNARILADTGYTPCARLERDWKTMGWRLALLSSSSRPHRIPGVVTSRGMMRQSSDI